MNPTAFAEAEPAFSVAPQSGNYFYEEGGYVPLDFSFTNTSAAESLRLLSITVVRIGVQDVADGASWNFTATVSPKQTYAPVRTLLYEPEMLGQPIVFSAAYTYSYSDEVFYAEYVLTLFSTEASAALNVTVSNRTPLPGEPVIVTYEISNPNPVDTTMQIYDPQIITDSNGRPIYYDYGTLAPGETRLLTRTILFTDSLSLRPQVIFACHLGDKDIQKTLSFDFASINAAEAALSVTMVPSSTEVIAGSQIYMTLTIVNTGNILVQNITAGITPGKTTLTGITLAPGSSYSKKIPLTVTTPTDFIATVSGVSSARQNVTVSTEPVTIVTISDVDFNVSLKAETYMPSLQVAGNITVRFTLTNLSGMSYSNVGIYEKSRGLIGVVDELDIGAHSYEFILFIAQSEGLEFHLETTGPNGVGYVGQTVALPITVGNATIPPATPSPTPVPTSGVDLSDISVTAIWSKLLSFLRILMIVSAVALAGLLIYYVYTLINIAPETAGNEKEEKTKVSAQKKRRKIRIKF